LSEVEVVDLAAASGKRAVSFGPFRRLPAQRLLLEGDKAVRLGSRALDILIALVATWRDPANQHCKVYIPGMPRQNSP
jgi:hypothetical protein